MPWRSVPDRAWFAALALAAVGLVAAGLEIQFRQHLSPCPLCIFQRLLYLIVGALALLACLWPGRPWLWAAPIGLASLGGVVAAAYQSWMQAFPNVVQECGYAEPNAIERLVDWLGMQWPQLFLATGFCSSRDWEFLRLSMANWSVLVFAGFAAFAAWLAVRKR